MLMVLWLAVAQAPAADIALGEAVYRRACVACHGEAGDGAGPAAEWLEPKPRDFTQGVYKFRTTMSGSNPTDADIIRTIQDGVPGTTMPAWDGRLSEPELDGLVAYLQSLSEWFDTPVEDDEIIVTAAQLAKRPEPTPAAVEAGAEVYVRMQCAKCHGPDGRGNPDNELEDDFGRSIVAFDFTMGLYKGGNRSADIYRSFTTGLDGTPMPSYDASLSEDERWELVYYVQSLSRRGFMRWLLQPPSWNHQRQ